MYQHNYLSNIFLFLTALFFLVACDQAEQKDTEQLLTGENGKIWKTDQQITASGDQRTLTQSEGEQRVQFNSDGTFKISDQERTETGTWTYKPTERTLELVYDEQPGIAETYYVTKLEEDALHVRNPDGATMQYTAE